MHILTVKPLGVAPLWLDYFVYKTSSATTGSGNNSPNNNDGDNSGKSKTNVGAIVGGVLGGIALLALIVAMVLFSYRKRKLKDAAAAKEDRYMSAVPYSNHPSSSPNLFGQKPVDYPPPPASNAQSASDYTSSDRVRGEGAYKYDTTLLR